MSPVPLNPETGLARLPEGYYWTVGRKGLVIMTPPTEDDWRWFEPVEREYFGTEVTPEIQTLLDAAAKATVGNYSSYSSHERKWVTEVVYYSRRLLFWLPPRPVIRAKLYTRAAKAVFVYSADIDADNVEYETGRALAAWELQKRNANLWGDYPPKSILTK